MADSRQHLQGLDAQTRAVIAARHDAMKRRTQAEQEMQRLASAVRKRRRERRLHTLGSELVSTMERLRALEAEDETDVTAFAEDIRAQMTTVPPPASPQKLAQPPALVTDDRLLGVLSPYYVYEVNVDTAGFIQDEHDLPLPPFRIFIRAGGSGMGWDDGDRHFETIDVSWLFRFVPPASRFYDFYPTTAFYGTVVVHSDDSIQTSLVAHARFRLRGAVTSSAGVDPHTADATQTIFDAPGDNIDEFRWMGVPGGGGEAQLHLRSFLSANSPAIITLTHELYVYGRGSGAFAQFDFEMSGVHGQQALGPVWCYAF